MAYLTTKQVANKLSVSQKSVIRRIQEGLPAIRCGRLYLVSTDKLAAWEKAQTVKAS